MGMKKKNFKNFEEPGISAENLNEVQDNVFKYTICSSLTFCVSKLLL